MIEIFKKPIEYLFDETKSKLSKITYLWFIILFLIFLNDIFWFSYNYNISNKISNINQIESIKKEYSNDYYINEEYLNKLNNLENKIIEKESFIYFVYNYLQNHNIFHYRLILFYYQLIS